MDQKIDATSPEAIRARLSPDLVEYMRFSDAEREEYDKRWKVYVERALYVLLTEGKLDRHTEDMAPLTMGDVAWLNRMGQFVISRHHNFDQPVAFGSCLSEKQFESVIRNKAGGERLSHLANVLSTIARSRGTVYNSEAQENKPEPGDAAANGSASGSEEAPSEHETFGAVTREAGRTRTTGRKPRR